MTIFLNSSEFCFKFGQKWLLFKDLFGEVHAVRTPHHLLLCPSDVYNFTVYSMLTNGIFLEFSAALGRGEKHTTTAYNLALANGTSLEFSAVI